MVDIKEEAVTAATLREYGTVSIAFLVETRYRVELIRNGLGGWTLTEEPVECPYGKDYDQIDGEEPAGWAARFDTSRWGMLSAFDGEKRVGGAVLALATPDVFMLEGRSDLAVLWDIRVQPDYRRRGVGALLFPRVVGWARERECTHLKVETQNINVPACKFYARMGASSWPSIRTPTRPCRTRSSCCGTGRSRRRGRRLATAQRQTRRAIGTPCYTCLRRRGPQ